MFLLAPAAGEGPFPEGAKKPGDHLRKVFYRMGLDDQDIVALSGLHLAVSSTLLLLCAAARPCAKSCTHTWTALQYETAGVYNV